MMLWLRWINFSSFPVFAELSSFHPVRFPRDQLFPGLHPAHTRHADRLALKNKLSIVVAIRTAFHDTPESPPRFQTGNYGAVADLHPLYKTAVGF